MTRKLFQKNLPRLVKRKLFMKYDNGEHTDYQSSIYIILHIFYRHLSQCNETIYIVSSICERDETQSLSINCPYFEIENHSETDYQSTIQSYILTNFGIPRSSVLKIKYANQSIIDNKCFNLFQVELNQRHNDIPSRYDVRSVYKWKENNDEETPEEEPSFRYHRGKWMWKEAFYLGDYAKKKKKYELSIDFFDDSSFSYETIRFNDYFVV